jgi:starch synthase
MRVLFVAAEVAPFVKTGGLADVAGALPAALTARGHDVRVIMPRYRALRVRSEPMAGPIAATFLPAGERAEEMRLYTGALGEVPVYFLDIPAAFERDAIYGERDDIRRFVLFGRGVLAAMQHLREVSGWSPDVVHGNDWHAALVLNYLRTYYAYTFGHIASVFTIHNLAYQGQGPADLLGVAGLSEGGLIENGMGPGVAGSFNCMARGIAFADVISTVSPRYAREMLSMEYGERLDGLLRHRQDRVAGILNGIDTQQYDPSTDVHLAAPFDAENAAGKAACKADLQARCGLPVVAARPLLGVVSRLAEQKGFVLLEAVLPWLLRETDAQLVLLGSGDARLEGVLQQVAAQHADRVAALAQQIYAGSDAFLMPSRFEPCGLGQMIALRYGSVPIVRATGGLADTVREGLDGNGFVFHPFDARHFQEAIARALTSFRDTDGWAQLRERGMRADHSWAQSATRYAELYEWARDLRRR